MNYTVTETAVTGYTTTKTGDTGTIDDETVATAAFTNTYSVEPTTASFSVKKVVSVPQGLTGPSDWTYTIKVEALDGAPAIETMEGTVTKASDTITFGNFTFDAPGTYQYMVTEEGTVDGVTNDAAAATGKIVTITVSDDGSGNLTAVADYNSENPLTFTNRYSVTPTTASFPVEKELVVPEGLKGTDITGKFTFTISADDGVPMPTVTSYTNPDADGGTVNFGPISYSAPGTYSYTITETGSAPGVTNDTTAAKTVTVTVTDKGDGTLEAKASSTTDAPLTFTNTYSVTTTTASFPVKKVLSVPEGMEGPAEWSYTIDVSANEGAPEAETMTGTVSNAADMATFGPFEFDKPGTYTYTVSESGTIAGVTNDANADGKTVTITVVDNGNGTLTATADSTTANPLTFTNTYNVGETTVRFPVQKILSVPEGLNGPETWSYTITVTAQNGAPEAETMTGTVSNANDTITFGPFKFTKPGTYTYTVTETGEVAGVTNDEEATSGKTVTITVVDNGNGTLTATASVTEEQPLTFTNTYSVSAVTIDPPVKKVLVVPEGLTGPNIDGKFTFTIKAASNTAGLALDKMPMPEKTSITNSSDYLLAGSTDLYEFGTITYTLPGTYTYNVTEAGEVAGVTNDQTATKTITVTVTDNGAGVLTAEVSSTTNAPLTFTNTYGATGSLDTSANAILTKTVVADGTKWAPKTFEFSITPIDGAPLAKDSQDNDITTGKATFTEAGTVTITFGTIIYTKAGT